jgi:Domain of unknown function (DUF4410)
MRGSAQKKGGLALWMMLALGVLVSGCAGTKGSISTISAPTEAIKLANYNELVVHVSMKDGATEQPKLIGEEAAERIKHHIVSGVKQEAAGRFREVNLPNPGAGSLTAMVVITNYDEGNAFARFMLAGLGQMHIDGEVMLSDFSSKVMLAKYEVSKTFAWGGVYGASKGITDIEKPFAEAVVEAILRRGQ